MEGQPFLQHLIERTHRYFHTALQPFKVKLCLVCKGILDKLRQVDAAQKTASACGKRLFRAGIHARIGEFLCIAQKVPSLDPVPEKCARFCIIPVRLGDPMEQFPRVHSALDHLSGRLSLIMEEIVFIVLHCLHKILTDPHGDICLCHFLKICLQIDKLFHIRMGTVDGDHQRSPAPVLSDERSDQRVQFHK